MLFQFTQPPLIVRCHPPPTVAMAAASTATPAPSPAPAPAPSSAPVAAAAANSSASSTSSSGSRLDGIVRALSRAERHTDVDTDAAARESVARHIKTLLLAKPVHLARLLASQHFSSGLWASIDALLLAEPTSQASPTLRVLACCGQRAHARR